MAEPFDVVGKSTPKRDGPDKVTGRTCYLHDLELPTVLPGIKVNTSPTNLRPIRAMQLERWDGKSWVLFGDVMGA